MNILDLIGNSEIIKQYTEKFGIDQEQLNNIVSNALPMLKEGADVNAIANKISETTGISLDTITPLLNQFAPQIQEMLSGKGGGISDLLGGLMSGENLVLEIYLEDF